MSDVEPSLQELLAQTAGCTFFVLQMEPTDAWRTMGPDDLRSHLLWVRRQESDNVVVLAGPLDRERHSGEGLCVIRAASREEAEAVAASDPLHQKGLRRNTVRMWTVNEGSITVNVALSTQRCSVT